MLFYLSQLSAHSKIWGVRAFTLACENYAARRVATKRVDC